MMMWRNVLSMTNKPFLLKNCISKEYSLLNLEICQRFISDTGKADSLPSLPVPPLDITLKKYLKSVEPLLSAEDFHSIEQSVKKFGSSSGEGENLQALLKNRAAIKGNWLSDWWKDVAYLGFRSPVTIHVSPGVILPSQKFKTCEEWLKFASKMVSAALQYKQIMETGKLETEYSQNKPLCMKQYYSLFSSGRIPSFGKDVYKTHAFDEESKHIIVTYKSNLYVVNVYDPQKEPMSTAFIYTCLKHIIKETTSVGKPIGILTTENRDTWAMIYADMMKDPPTKFSLDSIEKSLFILCLDETLPKPDDQDRLSVICNNMNHGLGSRLNSANRWADKTLQFIVSRDGAVGLNYEHTSAEGPPVMSLLNHVLDSAHKFTIKENSNTPNDSKPLKLPFKMIPSVKEGIKKAGKNLDNVIQNLDLQVAKFDLFGKESLKRMNVSPDGFIQVAIQLAHYWIYGKNTATYESGSLRFFEGGRTEVIRSCSVFSDKYCKAVISEEGNDIECATLLRNAIKAHKDYTNDVLNGKGIDRHLLGLKLSSIENGLETPDLFKSSIFNDTTTWKISTSQVSSKHDVMLSFAPVVNDGYGICYNPMLNSINFGISVWKSSPHTDLEDMKKSLFKALNIGFKLLSK